MLYRPYKPGDFEALYAIEKLCFEAIARFSVRYMRQLVTSTHRATWIAEENDRMTGFAIVEWAREAERMAAYIQTIEVTPEFRGHGIGAELLQRIEDSARAAGSELIWLHVDAENSAAIRLYEGHGYVYEATQENYYPHGRAALVYIKPLRREMAESRHESPETRP